MLEVTQDFGGTGVQHQNNYIILPVLSVKIGIHSGKIISGIVGTRKPQFALFGSTVNCASRMKSKSQENAINLSESTYNLLFAQKSAFD